jgi:hypothetical protein
MDDLKKEFKKNMESEYEKNVEVDQLHQKNREMNARINHQKYKGQLEEIERYNKIQKQIENEDLTNREFSRKKMEKDIEDRENAVTFINDQVSKDLIAAPGSLILVASMTNNGKSTLTAHIAETLVNEDKKVLVLSNEEKEQDVRARVSCLRTGISFGDYKTNKCTREEFNKVLDDAEFISKRLIVISTDNESDAYKVTTVKGVMTTLEKAKGKFDAVIIDYYTNVNMTEKGTQEPWHVNNTLASKLNIFKDSAPFPIIMFAQCESFKSDKKLDSKAQKDYSNNHPRYRWIGGKGIILYATDIVELERDFENNCSILFLHKVRFGHGEIEQLRVLPFDKKMQRFIHKMTPEWDAKNTSERVVRKTKEDCEKLGLGNIKLSNSDN